MGSVPAGSMLSKGGIWVALQLGLEGSTLVWGDGWLTSWW